MDKNNHIDDLFRSKLGNYQPEYVPEHWQMMKAAIESSPKAIPVRSGNFTAKLLIVLSALLILGSGIYTYLLTQKYNNNDTRNKTIALNSQQNNSTNQLNNFNRNISESGENSSPVVINNTPSQKNNVAEKNTNKNKSASNNPHSQNKTSRPQNVVSVFTSEKTATVLPENNKKTEKPLVNNTDIVALSNKEALADKVIDENSGVIEGPIVAITNILSQKTEQLDNKEAVNDKKEIVDSESTENNEEFTTVTDDYLAQKQKLERKYKRTAERKVNRSKVSESVSDCKMSMVNDFVVNPAYSGYNQRHTIKLSTLVHKPLFKPSDDFNVPFEYSIAYDFNFGKRKNCGLGMNYKRYLGAAEGSLAVDLTFAYRIFLATHHNLRIGVSASYLASDINKENLSFYDMIDSTNGFVYNTREVFPNKTIHNNFDLGMGVWYSWKTLFVSVSAVHLTSPEVGVITKARIPREYLLSAGYGFKMGKSFSSLPSVELKYNERILNISPSVLFTYKRWLLFGVEFQNLRNAGIVLGFNVKNNIIINIHGGVPMNKDIIKNFGVIDYAGLSLRLQFGSSR